MKVLYPILLIFFYFSFSCSENHKEELGLDHNNSFSVKTINIALKPNKNVQAQRELANKTIDIGYVSSSDAISFADNQVAEILVAGQHQSFTPEAQPYTGAYYYSVWLSLMDRPYKDISELKGKSVAFSSRTSTSGYLIPSWDLIKKGLVPEGGSLKSFFGEDNIFYGTGYVSAVEQVLEGKAEAAAVSYYVYEKDKHLTLDQRNKLRIIQRQGPVASHTFCVRSSLPQKDRNLLKKTLIRISQEEPNLSQSLFGGTLIGVDPVEHLKAPREAKKMVSTLEN